MSFAQLDASILSALKAGERLTPAIAAERWRCMALHSAIARLRDNGHDIKCVMRSANGRRYGEYSITGETPHGAQNAPASDERVRDPAKRFQTLDAVRSPPSTKSTVPPHKNCFLVETEGVGADGKRFKFSYMACEVA